MDQQRKIAKAAGVMSLATFISRILGFARDMIFAFYFGATGVSDTFFQAFKIPNLLRELLAEGSMSSAFIPVLTEYRQKFGEEEANRLVKITFTFILSAVGAICILGIIFSPAIVTLLAPGFLGSTEKFSLTVELTRIMFPFLLFVSAGALVMGALNTKKVFFVPAMAPAMLNVTLIVSIVFFESKMSQPIIAAAIGVAVGGFVQFAFQLPTFFRKGYRLGLVAHFRHPGLKKMALLLVPATLALSVSQINIIVGSIFASFLEHGRITYLFYAMRLMQFPVGIFGVAMGVAVLPTLAEHAVRGEMDRLRDDFSFALRVLFFISVPAMVGLIALKGPIVNFLFQRGQFDYNATQGTADALLFYALGIWSIVGVRIVTAAFYAMHDTKTPVKTAFLGMTTNIILSALLLAPLQHKGLALANSLASWVNFLVLFFFLRKKLRRVDGGRILRSFLKTCLASAVMGVAGWLLLRGRLWQGGGHMEEKALFLCGAGILCLIIYLGLSYFMKSEEMTYLYGVFRVKIRRREAQ